MTLFEFLAPIRRKIWLFLAAWLLGSILLVGLVKLIPLPVNSTIYFTIKPLESSEQSLLTDGVEAAEKLAETVAGWAKDPGFRAEILAKSPRYIEGFKRKLSARKQNRLNVFWNLTLSGADAEISAEVTDALTETIDINIAKFSEEAVFPLRITEPRVFREQMTIPLSWIVIGALFLSLILTTIKLYLYEMWRDRVSFATQVEEIFSSAPVLQISEKIGSHDEKLLEQFIMTFDSPRMIGTFTRAEGNFSLAPRDTVNEERDTPIFLVQLGSTTVSELKNLKAIFGDEVGIVVFRH